MNNRHFMLGASLYVPATRHDLVGHGNGLKSTSPRSVIFCTEDAVKTQDLGKALSNIAHMLPQLEQIERPSMRFIRVRNPHVLGDLLQMQDITKIDGFVIPKATRHNLSGYINQLTDRDNFYIMPTLETKECYDDDEMRRLRDILISERVRKRILTVRIGGNDLLNVIGVRRDVRHTIYDTAVGQLITNLSGLYKPHGINLSAPVFEGLKQKAVLQEEVRRDLAHGLFGKTAVHPDQIATIEAAFAVTAEDLEMARAILHENADAVFRMYDTMCEPATHTTWAESIIARSEIYGVNDYEDAVADEVTEEHQEMEFARELEGTGA